MLAENFLSAKELRIKNDMHAGLITLLGMLRRGEFELFPVPHGYSDNYRRQSLSTRQNCVLAKREPPRLFSMVYWASMFDGCGTVRCMGGTLETILHRSVREDAEKNEQLNLLFYDAAATMWCVPTLDECAEVLAVYLRTGRSEWAKVLQTQRPGWLSRRRRRLLRQQLKHSTS